MIFGWFEKKAYLLVCFTKDQGEILSQALGKKEATAEAKSMVDSYKGPVAFFKHVKTIEE